jgi:hypothetical protein
MIWEYQIDFPPDGGAGGASFFVAQNAGWEEVGLAWNKPANGDAINLVYGAQVVDIGSALDQTAGRQGVATDVGVHFNPFSMLIRMQFKAGPSPQNAGLPWCSSALNLLYHGPQDGSLSTIDPAVAGRPNLIKIGAEDNPVAKQSTGQSFTYQNLVMYISYAGPYTAKVTALNIPMPPCR